MRLLDRLHTSLVGAPDETQRAIGDFDDLAEWLSFNGWRTPTVAGGMSDHAEILEHSFDGYISSALKSNGIVFACVAARMMLFSEARFTWRNVTTGELFGDTALTPFENPSVGRTTQEMLALCELDVSFAGNSYWVRDGAGVRRLRPDWVGIVTGDPTVAGQRSTDLLGYTYIDGGPMAGNDPEVFTPDQVGHFSPFPDPAAQYRGMSWITPIVREIQADSRFTSHRDNLAKTAAIPTFAVQYPSMTPENFKEAVTAFRTQYEGSPSNSGKSIHIAGGADITPLQMDLRSMDFKNVQGGGETRIAAAARVPATIAGISEGLAGSSLNAGNYQMARRQFGDLFARPSWRSVCGAFSKLLTAPNSATELWYDDSDISFLREDQKDSAEVVTRKAEAIRTLTDGGYEPASVIAAVNGEDLKLLQHTGKLSVQLQEPGASPDQNTDGAQQQLPLEEDPDE